MSATSLARAVTVGVTLVFAAQAGGDDRREFRIDHPGLRELSGLARSRRNPGWLWGHNDSGAGAYLWAIDPEHRIRFRLKVKGAKALDWEDICLATGPDGRDWIYIGDIGRNLAGADAEPPRIWAIPEPAIDGDLVPPTTGDDVPTLHSERSRCLTLSFPSSPPPDAEGLFAYPGGKALGVVTKTASGRSRVFGAPLPRPLPDDAELPLQLVATCALPGTQPPQRTATAATVSEDGSTLVVLAYARVHLLPLPPTPGEGSVELVPHGTIDLPRVVGAEAITTLPDRRLLIGCEGRPARFVEVTLPPATPESGR